MNRWKAFSPDLEGVFVSRPNRFLAVIDTSKGRLTVHCPNPGRLRELLLPGSEVILEHSQTERKTAYTLVAVLHQNQWIPIASARANQAAGIFLTHLFPESRLKAEYSRGRSRFDYLMESSQGRTLVEVKSCTLAHKNIAMFPDAPSLRAVKHLHHLFGEPEKAMVVFVTYFSETELFIPHLHTDPDFAKTVLAVENRIDFRACFWSVSQDGWGTLINEDLPVNLEPLRSISYNKGLALVAWEGEEETVFAWAEDFDVWRKILSVRSRVNNLVGPGFGLKKVNDLRVYSENSLDESWRKFSEKWGTWNQGAGNWKELRVPGRPLDTRLFWEGFLEFRHQLWQS